MATVYNSMRLRIFIPFLVLAVVGIVYAQAGPPDITVRNLTITGTCLGCNGPIPPTPSPTGGPTAVPSATPWPDPNVPGTTFDEVNGTAKITQGSQNFTLVNGTTLNVSKCGSGNYWISIYGAGGYNLIGRQRPGLTAIRPLPLTDLIASCSDSTHGTTASSIANRSVDGTSATQCTGLDTSVSMDVNTRFSDGCTRIGTDVSALINSYLTTPNETVTLPLNANGYIAGAINVKAPNIDLEGNGTRLWSGWEGGVTYNSYFSSPGFYGGSCSPAGITASIGGASNTVLTVTGITGALDVPACGSPMTPQCGGAAPVGNSNAFTLTDYPWTGSPTILPGTFVTCQLTGTPCGTGTYTITAQSGTVSAEGMAVNTNSCQAGFNGINIVGTHPILTSGVVTTPKVELANDTVAHFILDGGLDFNWFDFPGAGIPDPNNPVPLPGPSGSTGNYVNANIVAGINAGYVSNLNILNNTIWNYIRGIGVIEDFNNVTSSGNTHYDCHEDCEHFGESLLPGDVSGTTLPVALQILNNTLWGYSDDGIALVGGTGACSTSLAGGPGGPVANAQIRGNVIIGSHNPGGSWIYNGAIQLSGNVTNAAVAANNVQAPAAESLQLIDFRNGAPRNVFIGGTVPSLNSFQGGCMPAANCNNANFSFAGNIDLGGPAIQISGEAGPNNPFFPSNPNNLLYPCPILPIANVQVNGTAMTLPALTSITVHRGNAQGSSFQSGSVATACVSAFGFISGLNINGNTCTISPGGHSLAGLWLDPDWMPSTITSQITWANNTLNNFTTSTPTIDCYGTNPPAACSISTASPRDPGIMTAALPAFLGGWAVDATGQAINTGQTARTINQGLGYFYVPAPTAANQQSILSGVRDFGFVQIINYPLIMSVTMNSFEYFTDANDGKAGVWMYDYNMGHWLYTNPATFPWLFDKTTGHNIMLIMGTSRWFFDGNTNQYFFG